MSAAFDHAQAAYDAAEPAEAPTPDCYHCSRAIEGEIFWDDDIAFHPQCAETAAN